MTLVYALLQRAQAAWLKRERALRPAHNAGGKTARSSPAAPASVLIALGLGDASYGCCRRRPGSAPDHFRYLTLVVPDLTPDVLHQNLGTLAPEVEQIVMTTLAEQWMAQGEARGRVEGARNLLLRLLELKFGTLPKDERERVEGADADQIRDWSVRILSAESLAALLAD